MNKIALQFSPVHVLSYKPLFQIYEVFMNV